MSLTSALSFCIRIRSVSIFVIEKFYHPHKAAYVNLTFSTASPLRGEAELSSDEGEIKIQRIISIVNFL